MKNIFITSIIFLATVLQMQAQHLSDAYYAQTIDQTQINPAYAKQGEDSKLTVFHRSLLSGIDGAPSNTAISFLKPLDENTGVGGRLTSDTRGVFSTLLLEGMYAYQISMSENESVTLGVSGGFRKTDIDMGSLDGQYVDLDDPTLMADNFGGYKFMAGAGAVYRQTQQGLELGVSIPTLVSHEGSLTDFVVAHGSVKLAVGNQLALKPNVIYQVLPNSKNQWQGTAQLEVKEKFWAMAGYRSNKSLIAGAGVKLNKLDLGYAYSASGGMLNDLSSGGHELKLSFSFPNKGKGVEVDAPVEE
ncbi:MAG: PorP/SprF family type IX secretion system membrane protein [Chitinophagales bacterium]